MALSERLQIVIDADATGAAGEFKKVSQAADRELGNLENLGRTAGRDLSNGIESGVGDPLNGLESDAKSSLSEVGGLGRSAGSELGANIESGIGDPFSGVAAEARSELGGLAPVGRDAGGDLSGGLLSGLNDFAGGASDVASDAMASLANAGPVAGAALAAGTAIGAMLMKGFSDSLESEANLDILTARLDLGTAEAAEVGRVSARLWADAWGESKVDVNNAIDSVYSTLDDSRASERALEELTAKAMSFAEVMGSDVATAVSNAGVLIDSGLARDANHAFDLMTEAARKVPQGVRDEIEEATQEYSQFFAGLGFSGEEAFGALVAAADGGRYAIDKTGDAVKEFRIRAVDMSAATVAAYDSIGLSAEDMTARILAGGDSARGAFVEVIEGIIALEDPAARSAAAVALMGAPFEDIAGDGARVDEILTNLAAGSLPDVTGAADDLAEAFDNSATGWESFKRAIGRGFEEGVGGALDDVFGFMAEGDATEKGLDWGAALSESIEFAIRNTLSGPGSIISELLGGGDPEGEGFRTGRFFGQGAARGAEEGAADVDWSGLRGGLGGWRSAADDAADSTNEFAVTLDDLSGIAEIAEGELDAVKAGVDAFSDSLDAASRVDDFISAGVKAAGTLDDLSEAIKDLPDELDLSRIAFGKYSDEQEAALGTLAGAGPGIRDYLAMLVDTGAGLEGVRDVAQRFRTELIDQMSQAGISKDAIDRYVTSLGLADGDVVTAFKQKGLTEAIEKVGLYKTLLSDMEGYPVELDIKIAGLMAEERYDEAGALAKAFAADLQDGIIQNPIVAEILGDSGKAELVAAGFRIDVAKNPAEIGVEANTQPAELGIYGLRLDEEGNPIIPPVEADTKPFLFSIDSLRWDQSSRPIEIEVKPLFSPETWDKIRSRDQGLVGTILPIAGEAVNPFEIKGGKKIKRHAGGQVWPGTSFEVNDQMGAHTRELLMPSAPGFVANATDTERLIKGVEAIVSGGGSGPLIGNLNITETASARETALETVRRIASRKQMAGAR